MTDPSSPDVGADAAGYSGVVLAGGYSARMGREKAELNFHGLSFLACQVEKLRELGIADILISGYEKAIPGTRFVPDVYPHRGPLSGVHAGLEAARNSRVLVLAVDTPLLPSRALWDLLRLPAASSVIWRCGGRLQPLPGVYDAALLPLCRELLQGGGASLRALLEKTRPVEVEYRWDPVWLTNCNTPEDYRFICGFSEIT